MTLLHHGEIRGAAHHFRGAVSAEAIGEFDVRWPHIGPVEEDDRSGVQNSGVHGRYAGVVQQKLHIRCRISIIPM